MSARFARKRTWLLATVAVLALVPGCRDDDPGTSDPTEPATSSTAAGPDDTTSPSESTEPAEPSTSPATGVLIEVPGVTARAPEGWKKIDQISTNHVGVQSPGTFDSVSMGSLVSVTDVPLAQLARTTIKVRGGAGGDLKLAEPVEIAGVPWFHITGTDKLSMHQEIFGTIHDGRIITLTFELDDELPAAERDEIIESVQATVEWT